MRVCTGGRAARRWCRPSISSRRSSTTRTSTARSRPPTRVSDIYAMGGRPLTALAIAAFPKDGLEPDDDPRHLSRRLRQAARGGRRRCSAATPSRISEIKFGYAVTGAIDPARVLSNAGARPGDVLFLTKPLGTGIVGTAIKFDRVDAALAAEAVRSMRTLESRRRRGAPDAARRRRARVHGRHRLRPDRARDRDGAGERRHDRHRRRVSCRCFPGVLAIAEQNRSGGMGSNQEHFAPSTHVEPGVDRLHEIVLYDPQTSGGLLIAADAASADEVAACLSRAGVPARAIGACEAAKPGIAVRVKP